jgi:DNA polymerase-3 subunit beta
MRIEINNKSFAAHLEHLRGVIERRNTIPVLSHVLIESISDSKLRLSATDLDNTLRLEVSADSTEGKMCLPLERLLAILKSLPDGESTIKLLDNDWAELITDAGKFKIKGMNAEKNWPAIQTVEGVVWECEAEEFILGLSRVASTIGQEEDMRWELRGVRVEVNGRLRFISTDGACLTVCEVKPEQHYLKADEPIFECLIPSKAIRALRQVVGDSGKLVCQADNNRLFFKYANAEFTIRKSSYKFPNYQMVIAGIPTHKVGIETDALMGAIKPLAAFNRLEGKHDKKSVRFVFSKGSLTLYALTPDGEEAECEVDCQADDEMEIKLEVHQVKGILANVHEAAEIFMEDKKLFTVISESDKLRLTQVCLPMN